MTVLSSSLCVLQESARCCGMNNVEVCVSGQAVGPSCPHRQPSAGEQFGVCVGVGDRCILAGEQFGVCVGLGDRCRI